jgi:hypothetical protein
MVDCKCREGFDCTYTKSVKGQVVLPVPPEAFDETMKRNFILAIAAAAGVDPSRVRIISIAAAAPKAGTRELGQKRRLRTEVRVRVVGASRIDRLDERLQQFGVPWRTGQTRAWQVDHLVEARRSTSALSRHAQA